MNDRVVKNPNFKNNGEFHRSLRARPAGTKDWPNTHTEVEHLGNGKFGASIGVGHRVFFDKADGNKPKKHKLTDERPAKDYVLIQGSKCCVEVHPYYAKYFDVQHEEVRLHEEQWVVQRLFKEPDTWRDADAYNPQIVVEEYPEPAGDVVKVTVTYDTDYGTLTVEYFQRDGNNLKHNINFKNTSGGEETFRVIQRWTGIVADEVDGEPVTELKSVQRDVLRFNKPGHLCIRENLSGFKPLPEPPSSLAGETLHCLNNQLTDAHELVASYENIKPMTLLLTETPRHVFLGRSADINTNVNIDYCEEQGIPVIRSKFQGRGYAYDEGSALYVALSCPSAAPESLLQSILSRAVNILGVPTSILGNDIRYGDARVGMTAPPLKNTYTVLGELMLDSDFDMVEDALFFPEDKWEGKPTNSIREWIKPLNTLATIDMAALKEAVVQAAQEILGVEIEWSSDGSDIPPARYPTELYQSEIDLHPQGLKADFIYGQWVLAQNESLEIDPDTAVLDDPTEDGDIKYESGPIYTRDKIGAEAWFGKHVDKVYQWEYDHRAYVEWDISGLAGMSLTANPIFKYHGWTSAATDGEINPLTEGAPFSATDADLYGYIASGTAYVDPFTVVTAANQSQDLGAFAKTDLQAAMNVSQLWFAIGFQSPGDEGDGGVSKQSSFYTEDKVDAATPKPTLYVEYSPAVGLENKSANMGSKMVAAGLI